MKTFLAISFILCLTLSSCDCVQHYSAVIYDQESKEPLEGVQVKKKGRTNIDTESRENGWVIWEGISGGIFKCPEPELVFSKKGYQNTTNSDHTDTIFMVKTKEEVSNSSLQINDSLPHFYWSLDLDTVKEEIPISMYNESYLLKTSKYSLNDSAIHRKVFIDKIGGNEGEMQEAIDVSHNYVVHLNLEHKGKTVVEKLITKDFFKDSLDLDFYNESTIFYSEYKSVRSNRMYFNLVLIKPDSDWAVELKYALFFQTKKKGQLDFWGVKYRE